MDNAICTIYEELYPYFSLPSENEFLTLEDTYQSVNVLSENRPITVIDLEFTEEQKAKLNLLKIETEDSIALFYELDQSGNILISTTPHNVTDNTVSKPIEKDIGLITFQKETNELIKRLSPYNDLELANELSTMLFERASRAFPNIIKNFINMPSGIGLNIHAYPAGYGNQATDWHVDHKDAKYFFATLVGSPTLYFVPSAEIYHELYGINRTEPIGSDIEKDLTEPLEKLASNHRLGLANIFSVQQGYATFHYGRTIHRAPDIGPARLVLGIGFLNNT